MSFRELMGKNIIDIKISEDDSSFLFLIDTAKSTVSEEQNHLNALWPQKHNKIPLVVLKFGTNGDCCNTVWFSDFLDLENLIDSTIFEVEEKPWINIDDPEHEVLEAAFWTFKTSKGYADIEVRNSHNGFYGGYVSFDGIYTDLSAFSQPDITENQKKITILLRKANLEDSLEDNKNKTKSRKI